MVLLERPDEACALLDKRPHAPLQKPPPPTIAEEDGEADHPEVRGLGQRWGEEHVGEEDPGAAAPYQGGPLAPPGDLGPLWVVLDLDHTLVYSQEAPAEGYDFFFTKGKQAAYVWKRPGLDTLLTWLQCARVQALVYTAASSSYCEGVSRHLDPSGTLFRRRLSRSDCPLTPPAKDLLRLGCDLRRTVLVDDSLSALRLQPDNGVPVSPYMGGPDEEMARVQALLQELIDVEDVRKVLCGRFRVAERLRKRATKAATTRLAATAAAVVAGRGHGEATSAAARGAAGHKDPLRHLRPQPQVA